MKRFLIIVGVIVFVGIVAALLTRQGSENTPQDHAPDAVSEYHLPDDVKLSIQGTFVDPLCFAMASAENPLPSYPVSGCEKSGFVSEIVPGDHPMAIRFYTKLYQSEQDMLRGMVGYRYLGDVSDHKAIWLIENTGGSGIFTLLSLLSYDEGTGMLVTDQIVASGDRCNGGVAEASIQEGQLVYERDMTPFDVVSLVDDTLSSDLAMTLPACAACCYARAHYKGEALTGLQFDLRLPKGFAGKTYGEGRQIEQCFDERVQMVVEQGSGYLDRPALDAFVHDIQDTCLKESNE